jgi:hypothetical protein
MYRPGRRRSTARLERFAIACTVGADLRVGPRIGCTGNHRGPIHRDLQPVPGRISIVCTERTTTGDTGSAGISQVEQ